MSKRLLAEMLWIIATLILVVLILLPIYQNENGFNFYIQNIAFIFILITFTRYIFILPTTYLFKNKWPKAILFFLCIPIFFFLMDGLLVFQTFMDENGISIFYEHLPFAKQKSLGSYTRNEMIFFGVGSLITTVILPFRLIISTWRDINNKN